MESTVHPEKPCEPAGEPFSGRLAAVILLLSVLFLVAVFRPRASQEELNPADVRVSVDPNAAPWWELTILPGIGEVRAKEIVSFRESEALRRGLEPGEPVFRAPTDLEAVRGIGPGIVRQIAAELHFGEKP